MWQFAESIRGMRDACEALGTPVTGGNVSFYNESGDSAIDPTPVIGMLGLLAPTTGCASPARSPRPGSPCISSARRRRSSAAPSSPRPCSGVVAGMPPALDVAKERALLDLLVAAAGGGAAGKRARLR